MFKIVLYILLCIKYIPFISIFIMNRNPLIKEDIDHYSMHFKFRINYCFTLCYLLEKYLNLGMFFISDIQESSS